MKPLRGLNISLEAFLLLDKFDDLLWPKSYFLQNPVGKEIRIPKFCFSNSSIDIVSPFPARFVKVPEG